MANIVLFDASIQLLHDASSIVVSKLIPGIGHINIHSDDAIHYTVCVSLACFADLIQFV